MIHSYAVDNRISLLIPSVTLLVKRSELRSNGLQNHGSPCIISQKWFMALSHKARYKEIAFSLHEVDYRRPLPEDVRRKWSITRLPALLIRWPKQVCDLNGSFVCDPDKGGVKEQLLMDSKDIENAILRLPGGKLFFSLPAAEKVISTVYMRFNGLLRADQSCLPAKERALLTDLVQINDYLEREDSRFLCGDDLTLADCDLMPKLQHIRVAGEFYKGFTIPTKLKHLWMYLKGAYETEAFCISCPFDQEIVVHYQSKVLMPNHTLVRPTLQKLSITNTIPT